MQLIELLAAARRLYSKLADKFDPVVQWCYFVCLILKHVLVIQSLRRVDDFLSHDIRPLCMGEKCMAAGASIIHFFLNCCICQQMSILLHGNDRKMCATPDR